MADAIYFPKAEGKRLGVRQVCHLKFRRVELWAGRFEMPDGRGASPWFERRGGGEFWFGDLQVVFDWLPQ